jgi:hypothetical protein
VRCDNQLAWLTSRCVCACVRGRSCGRPCRADSKQFDFEATLEGLIRKCEQESMSASSGEKVPRSFEESKKWEASKAGQNEIMHGACQRPLPPLGLPAPLLPPPSEPSGTSTGSLVARPYLHLLASAALGFRLSLALSLSLSLSCYATPTARGGGRALY